MNISPHGNQAWSLLRIYIRTFLLSSALARKNKKLIRLKVQQATAESAPFMASEGQSSLVLKSMPQLVPTMLSLLKAIEPEIVYAGYDSTVPDTSTRLMTTLNRLGGRQVISAVKWAKALPGKSGVRLRDLLMGKKY